jgi:dTDP-4-dehydrorhamnose reductase
MVTGASGLLGANLVLQFQQRGKDVIAIYHQHKIVAHGVKSLRADLTEKRAVDDLLERLRPGWIIHCAALTDVDWCEEHPAEAHRVNVQMSRNLAVAAGQVSASLVYISTDSVFDGKRGHYSEADIPAPVNTYAGSKLEGEKAVQDELGRSLVIRTNIYGWNMQARQSLAEWVLARLGSGQRVPGFHDVVFTPILVNDLGEIILDMMKQALTGLYHVAGSQACSKYEFALRVADTFSLERQLIQSVSIKDSHLKAPRPGNTSLQTNKVSQALGRPMPDLKSGLQRFKELRDSGFATQLKALTGGLYDAED